MYFSEEKAAGTVSVSMVKVSNGDFRNYCYIIFDRHAKVAVVVDPAWQFDRLVQKLDDLSVSPIAVVLTHSHIDHVNLADAFADTFRIPVLAARAEVEYYDFRPGNLLPVEDKDRIMIAGSQIQFLVTPGHTPGSMCCLADGHLFTGDTLFIEGCGICDGPGGDPEAMYGSLQRLKREIAPSVKVYPGHTYGRPPGLSFKDTISHNLYLNLDDLETFVSWRMRPEQPDIFKFV